MPENRENKEYTAGPWGGNKCCHCCYRCDGDNDWAFNNCTGCPVLCCTCPPLCDLEVVITATCCDGLDGVTFTMEKASWPQAPWNGTDLESPIPRKRIRMADHYCVHDNPTSLWQVDGLTCYETDQGLCQEQGNRHPYEKWANITYCPEYNHDGPAPLDELYRWGEMFCPGSMVDSNHGTAAPWESNGYGCVCEGDCPDGEHEVDCDPEDQPDAPIAPDPPCGAGQWMTFSLCCCDRQQSSVVTDDFTGECKTCSYQFRTEWSAGSDGPYLHFQTLDECMPPRALGTSRVCTCSDSADVGWQEAIPPDRGEFDPDPWAPGHGNGYVMIWEHVDGDCGFSDEAPYEYDPSKWRMEYRLGTCEEPVHWNCDCCFNTVKGDWIGEMRAVKPAREAYFTAVITAKAGTCQSDGGP